jgi:hypothetical protein
VEPEARTARLEARRLVAARVEHGAAVRREPLPLLAKPPGPE